MTTENESTLTPEEKKALDEKRALILKWNNDIKSAKDAEAVSKYHKKIKQNRLRVEGFIKGESGEEKTRTNLIYSTIRAQQARVYAKNPEIQIRPSKAVSQKEYAKWKTFCLTAEVVLNRQLSDAKLKKRGKASVRASLTSNVGWVKVVYQDDIEEDPKVIARIQDTQDNIRKIEALMCDCENEDETKDYEAKKAQLEIMVESLESEVEVSRAEGLVVDRILSEDMLWDPDVAEFEMVSELSRWMAQGFWYDEDEFNEVFGRKPHEKATTYSAKKDNKQEINNEHSKYRVWEIWDRVSNTIYTVCEGDIDYCRDPYQPTLLGERWYPFFDLALIPVDGAKLPMSAVEMLEKLQDEYEETRDKFVKHREVNVPHYILSSDTDEKSIQRKQNADMGELVIIDTDGRPLNQVFQKAESLNVNPMDYDTSAIRNDFEYMSGLGDSARGGVSKAKTLGEAQLMEANISSRSDDMTDIIEDWMLEIGRYSLEVLLQELNEEQVKRIAGEDAQWPEMSKEDLFDMVNIEVRAGSSGKPNKMQEQQTWVEFMPKLQELIAQVAELREADKDDLADSMIMIARETIRRFDDRIDIEEFLPKQEEDDAEESQQKIMAMQKQAELDQAEIEQLKANIRDTNASAEKKETETDLIVAENGLVPEEEVLQV